jgi:hypothetical protein
MCQPTPEEKVDQFELLKLQVVFEPDRTPQKVRAYLLEHSCECVKRAVQRLTVPQAPTER